MACEPGKYQTGTAASTCIACTACDRGFTDTTKCTATTNRVCEGAMIAFPSRTRSRVIDCCHSLTHSFIAHSLLHSLTHCCFVPLPNRHHPTGD